ncbi:porin PorA family protein [Nocardia noduli]|uniref:porin PorA family protein n=1 Tax=Nocardia noduli TaxID=2815722 RepID=UPI001C229E34|nr:porin PorA family protein [Nocardia noduli]
MRQKRFTIALSAIGIVLIAAAPVLHFGVAPALTKLPESLDDTTRYDGSMSVPDPNAPGKLIEQPIVLERRIKADSVDGSSAVITVSADLFAAPRSQAAPLSRETHTYAVDRADFGQANPPAGVAVTDQLGAAVFALPQGFATTGNRLFDANTRTAVPLVHESTDEIAGRTAETFHARSSGAVADPALLTQLRTVLGASFGTDGTSIPASALTGMGIPAETLTAFGATIPVTPVIATDWRISADRRFGLVLDLEQQVQIDAVIGNSTAPILITPLQRLNARTNDTEITDIAATLDTNANKLDAIQWWIPLAAALIGIGLIVIAIVRRTPATAPATPNQLDTPDLIPAESR